MEEREDKPTALMPRDELLDLVQASAQPVVATHAVPRALVRGSLSAMRLGANDEIESVRAGVSPVLVFAVVVSLLGTFFAIVLGT